LGGFIVDIDRIKLTKHVGEAIGIDLLSLKSFELKVEKKAVGGLSIRLHLFDDTSSDVAKKLAAEFATRYEPAKPQPPVATPQPQAVPINPLPRPTPPVVQPPVVQPQAQRPETPPSP
jgi:hypothetical protein